MPQQETLRLRGVFTHPNRFSEVPEGALSRAENVVIDRESLIEPRRGKPFYGSAIVSPAQDIQRIIPFDGKLVVHYGSALEHDDADGSFSAYATALSAPASGFRVRDAIMNGNLYLTSSVGLRKIDEITDDHVAAGVHAPLDSTYTLSGSSGYLSDDMIAAYRAVLFYEDENDNEIVSAPSARLVVVNEAGGSRNIALTWYIPSGLTTDHYWRVYRSPQIDLDGEPSDELQLAGEGRITSTDISNGFFALTDSTPDSLRGANLYTNPLEEGIQNANDQPPLAKDICPFNGFLLYANVSGKHRFFLTLLGTGTLSVNDTLKVAGRTYTAKAAEDDTSQEFLLATSGTPSENIEDTARSIVRVVNADSSATVYAFYDSGSNDAPGIMRFQERGLGGSSFQLSTSQADAFSPTLPATDDGSQTSSADLRENFVAVSKLQQPEAVPLGNRLWCGNTPIRRILALREAVFVLSDVIGIVTGTDISNFSFSELDTTTKLTAPESAIVVNDAIYCDSNQGVVRITQQGVQVISRQIEQDIRRAALFTDYASKAFAFGYETDRCYFLAVPTGNSETPSLIWRYNAFTSGWQHFALEASCAVVDPVNDKLLIADPDTATLRRERKALDSTDYADEEFDVTISSSTDEDVTLADATGLEVGDLLVQSALRSRITAIDGDVVTVEDDLSWSAAAATAYRPITAIVDLVPISMGAPSVMKHFPELTLLFRDAEFEEMDLYFANNFFPNFTEANKVSIRPADTGSTWTEQPSGSAVKDEQPIRVYVPRELQRCHWLRLRMQWKVARETFALAGLGVTFRPLSTRFRGARS